jgi:hypothetical protein
MKLANKLRHSGWVQLADIAWALRHAIPPPRNTEQLAERFVAALAAGIFNRAGKTRVFLLDESDDRSPRLRLTPERAQHALHDLGSNVFEQTWVEFEPALAWSTMWLGSLRVPGLRNPMIEQSFRELTSLFAPLPPAPPIGDSPSSIKQPREMASEPAARPGVRLRRQAEAQAEWERRLRALIESGKQPSSRAATLALARENFAPHILSDKAFGRVWDKLATLQMKKPGPKGPRTPKG